MTGLRAEDLLPASQRRSVPRFGLGAHRGAERASPSTGATKTHQRCRLRVVLVESNMLMSQFVASRACFSRSRTTSARVTSKPVLRIFSVQDSTRATSGSGSRNENCLAASSRAIGTFRPTRIWCHPPEPVVGVDTTLQWWCRMDARCAALTCTEFRRLRTFVASHYDAFMCEAGPVGELRHRWARRRQRAVRTSRPSACARRASVCDSAASSRGRTSTNAITAKLVSSGSFGDTSSAR